MGSGSVNSAPSEKMEPASGESGTDRRGPAVAVRQSLALELCWRVGLLVAAIVAALVCAGGAALAQTRIMALGDSITHGGQGFASYRYPLWFALDDLGFAVELVGRQTEIFGGDPPNLLLYPEYLTQFDPDHEGYWGFRTDQIEHG